MVGAPSVAAAVPGAFLLLLPAQAGAHHVSTFLPVSPHCPPTRMCPIFQISNVTGENLDLLKMFLNLLSPRTSYREEEPAEFQIDDTYSVPVRGFRWAEQGWEAEQRCSSGATGASLWCRYSHWAGVFPAGCGDRGVRDNTEGPDQAERHAVAGPRSLG